MELLQPPAPTQTLADGAAAWGLVLDAEAQDPDPQPAGFEVWPDLLPAIDTLIAMRTQWATGIAGPIGLRYEVLPLVFGWLGIGPADHAATWDDLRILEQAQLDHWAQSRATPSPWMH